MPAAIDRVFADELYSMGEFGQQIDAELRRGWHANQVMAQMRQEKIAAANQAIEESWIEGVGQRTMSVDADVYHEWGQRLGYDCWHDEQFCREFKRDNPAVRVETRPRKTTIVKP